MVEFGVRKRWILMSAWIQTEMITLLATLLFLLQSEFFSSYFHVLCQSGLISNQLGCESSQYSCTPRGKDP